MNNGRLINFHLLVIWVGTFNVSNMWCDQFGLHLPFSPFGDISNGFGLYLPFSALSDVNTFSPFGDVNNVLGLHLPFSPFGDVFSHFLLLVMSTIPLEFTSFFSIQ
jgi:hypothetical protein